MADREIAGRCTCPICGLPSQDVRVNVNQKLYCYCDNGCSFKFNSSQSRKFLPDLRSGRNVATSSGIMIFSTNREENKENDQIKDSTGRSAGTVAAGNAGTVRTAGTVAAGNAGRVDAGRRTTDNAGNDATGRKRGFFAGWLDDDDDE